MAQRDIVGSVFKTNILGGGVLRDISSKLTRQIFPVAMAQREIVGSVLRLIF